MTSGSFIATHLDTARIIADLNALSDDLKEKAVKAGVAKVAASGLTLLKQHVPVDSGNVQASLSRKQLAQRGRAALSISANTVAVLVGPNRRVKGQFRSRIANILEGGANAHEIVPEKSTLKLDIMYAQGLKRKADILYDKNTKKYFGKKVNHPSIHATGFIAQSDSANASQAESLFFTGVQAFLDRRA